MDQAQWRIQDFPEVEAPTLEGGRQHKILPNFPKNCIKLKWHNGILIKKEAMLFHKEAF